MPHSRLPRTWHGATMAGQTTEPVAEPVTQLLLAAKALHAAATTAPVGQPGQAATGAPPTGVAAADAEAADAVGPRHERRRQRRALAQLLLLLPRGAHWRRPKAPRRAEAGRAAERGRAGHGHRRRRRDGAAGAGDRVRAARATEAEWCGCHRQTAATAGQLLI